MTHFVHGRSIRADGTSDSHFTREVQSKDAPLWWQTQGLQFTASGYGSRIPTRTMVLWNGRWRRVYVRIYSNAGTAYIGRIPRSTGELLTVSEG
jgi:hypothetical protein